MLKVWKLWYLFECQYNLYYVRNFLVYNENDFINESENNKYDWIISLCSSMSDLSMISYLSLIIDPPGVPRARDNELK